MPLDDSSRWLLGEEAGGLRDMWNPPCTGHPGKVSDRELYVCDPANDEGGVHANAGVPNHAFALMVDGGTYNGHSVGGIGLTKAAHIYFRAMGVYQVSDTDFADHADAIEQSCDDLLGADLRDPATGASSGQPITADDCAQVASSMLTVEMRMPPCEPPPSSTTTTVPVPTSTTTMPAPPTTTTTTTLPQPTFLDTLLGTVEEALETTSRAQLRRRRALTFRFAAPSAGKLIVDVRLAASDVIVANGRTKLRRPGPGKIRVKLTKRGKRLLGSDEALTLVLEAGFSGTDTRLTGSRDVLIPNGPHIVGDRRAEDPRGVSRGLALRRPRSAGGAVRAARP